MSISSEHNVSILHEFSGPLKFHHLHELVKGDQAFTYPLIKRDPLEESYILQKPAEIEIRARSDFAVAASTKGLGQRVMDEIQMPGKYHPIPCLSKNLRCHAVAIVAEVKATSLLASATAAKNQWSSLAYLQMMERV